MEHILFFTFRLYGGGAERVISNLSTAFSGRYAVTIVVYDDAEHTYAYEGNLVRVRLPFSRNPARNGVWKRLVRFLLLCYRLRKIKQRQRIDVSVSFAEQANIVNLLTRRKERTIISVRTFLSQEMASLPRMQILKRCIRYLYRQADQIVVPSQLSREDLRDQFHIPESQLRVIHNYVEESKIMNLAEQELADPFLQSLFEKPVLLHVGRITAAKGQWLLLAVMARLKTRYPDWKLVIMGEDRGESNLKSRLLGLGERWKLTSYDEKAMDKPHSGYDIFWLGFRANPFQFMKRSRVLLLPSVFEGFPNTLLEAMFCGLPVVAADCPSGPREILAPDSDPWNRTKQAEMTPYGVLCPALSNTDPEDFRVPALADQWTEALCFLIEKNLPMAQYALAGLQRARAFDKAVILDQWEKTFSINR
jgi:glycosyltransferase involved in cell wall biosynthesis